MNKVLVSISSDVYVRNYLRSNALSGLEEDYLCHFIAEKGIFLKEDLEEKPGFLGYVSIPKPVQQRHRLLFNIMMWKHRKKSRTFFYRWMRNAQWQIVDRARGPMGFATSFLRWFASALTNPQGLIIPALGNRVVFPIASLLLRRSIPLNKELLALVKEGGYQTVVIPSAAFDELTVDLIRVTNKLNVTSLCLIDNWDNLTSKSVFWEKPSHIGVWGPQATKDAKEIHGFAAGQIHEIGTPRFDQYFTSRLNPSSRREPTFPYILFVGSAMPFDEISALHLVEELIESSQSFPSNLQIIYRPHPWQQKRKCASRFVAEDFQRVHLDTQIQEAWPRDQYPLEGSTEFQPDLAYYPSLLSNAVCVIGPLTTMLLEAAICLRPVIGLNYYDRIHNNTTRRYFSHFDGAEKIPGFWFCSDQKDLEELIVKATNHPAISPEISDKVVSEFVLISPHSYSERLLQTVRSFSEKI